MHRRSSSDTSDLYTPPAPRVLQCRYVAERPLLLLLTLLLFAEPAWSHSPHDQVIRLVVGSSLGSAIPVLYAVVRSMVVMSCDTGWKRLSNGLWREKITDIDIAGDRLYAVGGKRLYEMALAQHHAEAVAAPFGIVQVRCTSDSCVVRDGDANLYRRQGRQWEAIGRAVSWLGDFDAGRLLYAQRDGTIAVLDSAGRPSGGVARFTHGEVRALAWDGDRPLVATAEGLYRARDRTFERLVCGDITSVAVRNDEIYASLWREGVLVSRDHGRSWSLSAKGLTRDPQADASGFGVPHFSMIGLSRSCRRIWLAGFDGLFYSDDAGQSWAEDYGVLPRTLLVGLSALERELSDELFIAYYGAGFAVRDAAGFRLANRRLGAIRSFGAQPSPLFHTDRTLLAAQTSTPLFSRDGGSCWMQSRLGLPSHGVSRLIGTLRRSARYSARRTLEFAPQTFESWFRKKVLARQLKLETAIRIPMFGVRFAYSSKFSRNQLVYLASRSSGLYRSVDGGQSWQAVGRFAAGELIGIGIVSHASGERLGVLTPADFQTSDDGGQNFTRRDRGHSTDLDQLATDGKAFWLATSRGLFSSSTGEIWQRHKCGRDASDEAYAAVQFSGGRLFAQRDDGSLWQRRADGAFALCAPPGSPIFRNGVAFPDISPMLGLCNSGLYGTDQYSLYSLCGEATTAIVRHVMIGINRPEILKTRGWLVTPHAHALVGYRGFSLGGELSFRFHGSAIWLSGKGFLPAGQAEIILDGRPQLLSNRNKADDVLWHSGNLAVGEHTLRLKSLRGLLSLDGIGIAMQ